MCFEVKLKWFLDNGEKDEEHLKWIHGVHDARRSHTTELTNKTGMTSATDDYENSCSIIRFKTESDCTAFVLKYL